MSDLLCVTNRKLCGTGFLRRIDQLAACKPAGIILREKDLSEEEYKVLAEQVLEICRAHGTACILHSFAGVAAELGVKAIHLPLPMLYELNGRQKAAFTCIGASCHSVRDAIEAQRLGCTYITAGHVFETDCKKGMPGRGIGFLQNVVHAVELPVYAIGGIDSRNIRLVRAAGARGACVMSGAMACGDIREYMKCMEEGDER